MPTNHDETLHERYTREHQAELASFASMTPEQISELVTDLHNALAERDAALAELAAERKASSESRGALWAIIDDREAELAALKGGQEAVYWQVRNHDDQYGWSQWEFIKPTNSYFGQTVETMLADYRTYFERGYKYELRALYTAPPAQASAWVAVSERMPEVGVEVWCHGGHENRSEQHEFVGYLDTFGFMACNNGDYIDGGYGADYDATVTHWQPLPAAPIPGDSDGKDGE